MRKITMRDLETMTTHELADLFANITFILRRLPNVPLQELKHEEQPPKTNAGKGAAKVQDEQAGSDTVLLLPDWVENKA
jgi:hypothetical protein